MNTEQIINELEGLVQFLTCPSYIKDALALIKEQQGELTYCYDKLTELEKECLGLSLHNINLKKENKYLRERLAEEAEIKEDMKGK